MKLSRKKLLLLRHLIFHKAYL